MMEVFVRAKITDINSWRPVFDGDTNLRRAAGEITHRIFYNADNTTEIFILFEWESRAKAEGYFQSDAALKSMADSGIVSPPEFIYVQELRMLRRTAAD